MKLIYIANVRIPTEKAHGLQIMKMCESFSLNGVKVELIIPTRINKKFKKINGFDFYSVLNNFKIIRIKSFDPTFLFGSPAGFYVKIQSFFFIVGLFFYLLFKKDKSEFIFYSRDEYLLPLLQLFSKRVVWECHNLPQNSHYYLKYLQRCLKIIAITQFLKEELINLGLSESKIIVAPDAVDLKEFMKVKESKDELRRKLDLSSNKHLIIYAGHLYSWKGAQVLAEAMKFLSNNEVAVFIGGTDNDIEKFKEKNQDISNILILGYKSHDKIPYYLKAADILVLPNSATEKISSYYTSPVKMFEYMASQRPIVAS